MKVYPLAIDHGFGPGAIDYLSDTVTALLVSDTYVYADVHEFLDDVAAGARLSSVALTGRSISAGEFKADDVTFPIVPIGDTATGVLIFVDTGDETTSRLISYHDRGADTVPISIPTNDGDIVTSWPLERIFRL